MRTILYRTYGEPANVLELAEATELSTPGANEVRIRVMSRPIHPGDLLGVAGRYRAPSDTSNVAAGGARPGFEGMGVIEEVGTAIDPSLGLSVGSRVAFFPGRGAWGEQVIVSAKFVTIIPDEVSDEIAAQLHVNPLTALMLLRAVDSAGVIPGGEDTVVLTAAGSGVAKLVAVLAKRRGFKVVSLIRNHSSLADLAVTNPSVTCISTDRANWQDHLRTAIDGKPVRAVIDAVGGEIASNLLTMLANGGTFISYGDLSGEPISATALSFSVRNIRVHGVSVGGWANLPEEVRIKDIHTAMTLAKNEPALFRVTASYDLADITKAVEHSQRVGKTGAILLTSR